MKGHAELRRRVQALDAVELDRALEAAIAHRFSVVDRILAAVPAPRPQRGGHQGEDVESGQSERGRDE